jgi:hypothetical protein
MSNPQSLQNTINEQGFLIQQLTIENGQLKDKLQYLEDKIKKLISDKITEKVTNLSQINPQIV